MTMLSIIQAFCTRTGIPKPTVVADSSSDQVVQVLALLNEVCEDLDDRGTWQALTQQSVFTTVLGRDQGAMTTLAPAGFFAITNETIFNRTLRLPIFGPMSPQQWQAILALPTTGPFYKYRILDGHLMFDPPISAGAVGQTCAFEYTSTYLVKDNAGVAKEYFTADSDLGVLPDPLYIAGLRWKWKSEKGLDYAEDFRRYETLVVNALGRDGGKPRLAMDQNCNDDFRPGIWVPSGNWNV